MGKCGLDRINRIYRMGKGAVIPSLSRDLGLVPQASGRGEMEMFRLRST